MHATFGRLLSALNFAASLLIVGLMLLITADVVGRVAFGSPLYGVPEITKLSVVCIVWLQMAYTLHVRQHLRSSLILGALPVSGQRAILIANCLAGAALMALIAYYSYPELLRAWRTNAFEGEHPVRIPTWPIWAILVAGSALTAAEYVVQAVQTLRGHGEEVDASQPVLTE